MTSVGSSHCVLKYNKRSRSIKDIGRLSTTTTPSLTKVFYIKYTILEIN